MNATFGAKFGTDKSSAAVSFSSTVGNIKLSTSFKDVALGVHPSPYDVSFSLEKPDSFSVNISANKDIKFNFMNSIPVLTKAVDVTYTHEYPANRTGVDGTFVLDKANKMTVSYGLGTGDCKLKYKYERGEKEKTQVVVEPTYDLKKDAWDLAVTGRFEDKNAIKATYAMTSNVLGVEWSRNSLGKGKGSLKVSTSINLAEFNLEERKALPNIVAETSWNFDL